MPFLLADTLALTIYLLEFPAFHGNKQYLDFLLLGCFTVSKSNFTALSFFPYKDLLIFLDTQKIINYPKL